jgi:hypothetical protein
MKKCEPFKCTLFQIAWKKYWERMPMDVFIVRCPNRVGAGIECKEEFENDGNKS